MDVASDRLNLVQASKLRLVKDMRERSALRELSNREGKRRIADERVKRASDTLASAEKHRASVEAELYLQLASIDTMSVAELDRRRHIVIERLAAGIASARQALEEACVAREQAEAEVVDARALWTRRLAARRKWEQIESDVHSTTNTRLESAAEIEADDEVLLRYQCGSPGRAVGDSI
ncbi:hypothetical protein H8B02_10470 [Bradyrhizobium sp. Pear77]|uniref:hypothetical protein n=1 Tax=Bradyrhizobium TaxID=374 RepID=UPI00289F7FC7|nr:hypothetical protein [Bradyrhizobium altum]MCC8953863.1 hypothetical protein [Bradyrhizobium altum]MCC8963022.1 hypothetical protein [Bradyrhizobium oropedii]